MDGRPKEGLDTLPENWQSAILALYREGASDVEVKAWIYEHRGSFSNDLWDRWLKEEHNFSETIKTGRLLEQKWWEQEGRKALRDKDFSYTGWYMNMKNRFGWADNQKVDHGGELKTGITVQVIQAVDPIPESESDVTS